MRVPKEYHVALMEWYGRQYILQTPGDSEYYLDSLEWKQQYYIHGHTALDLVQMDYTNHCPHTCAAF